MALHGKKPLKGRNYYFDLRFYRNQDNLIKDVKKFGGKVDSFLSKEVTHVVTDRHCKSKLENFAPMTPKSLLSISSPMNDSYMDLWGTQSPLPDGLAVSRGQAILQKAKQMKHFQNEGSTNILNFCNQWDIKILPLQKLLDYISRCKTWVKTTRENKVPREKSSFKFKQFRQVLNAPFMKVEDKNRNFKPFYKEFENIKDCFNHTAWRVYNRMQKHIAQTHSLVLKPNQMHNIMASTSSSKLATSKPGSQNPANYSRAHQSNAVNPKKNIDVKNEKKKKGSKKVTDKKRFCEICSVSFLNIKEHLLTPKHTYFMSNPKNYEIIKEIIQSLPTVEDFLKRASQRSNPSAVITNEINQSGVSSSSTCDSVADDTKANILKSNGSVTKDLSQSTDTIDVIPASCDTEECPNSFPFLNCEMLLKAATEFRTPEGWRIVDQTPSSIPLLAEPFDDASKINNVDVTNESLFCYESIAQPSDSYLVNMGVNLFDPLQDFSLESGNKFGKDVTDIPQAVDERMVRKELVPFDCCEEDELLRREHRFFFGNSDDSSDDSDICDDVKPKRKKAKSCSREPEPFNGVLNVHGCTIQKYPFRNFGYGTVPVSPVRESLATNVKIDGSIQQQDENEQLTFDFHKDDSNLLSENKAIELLTSYALTEDIPDVNIMSVSEFLRFSECM